jgi:hypothetical protein
MNVLVCHLIYTYLPLKTQLFFCDALRGTRPNSVVTSPYRPPGRFAVLPAHPSQFPEENMTPTEPFSDHAADEMCWKYICGPKCAIYVTKRNGPVIFSASST